MVTIREKILSLLYKSSKLISFKWNKLTSVNVSIVNAEASKKQANAVARKDPAQIRRTVNVIHAQKNAVDVKIVSVRLAVNAVRREHAALNQKTRSPVARECTNKLE